MMVYVFIPMTKIDPFILVENIIYNFLEGQSIAVALNNSLNLVTLCVEFGFLAKVGFIDSGLNEV